MAPLKPFPDVISPNISLAFNKRIDDDFSVDSFAVNLAEVRDTDPVSLLRQRFSVDDLVDAPVLCEGIWNIHVTVGARSNSCPWCYGSLVSHGWMRSTYLDSPLQDSIVRLHVKRRRFICPACNKTLTPVARGMVEGPKVTARLVDYIRWNLWSATSLRALAASVGALPKTVAVLLGLIARDARLIVAKPAEIGIHELWVGKHRHLVITNLAGGTVVDFLSDGQEQIESLAQRLAEFDAETSIRVAAVPADDTIVHVVARNCPAARIAVSLSAIHSLLADASANLNRKLSRKGRQRDVSNDDGRRLVYLRATELSEVERAQIEAGRREQDGFWMLFDAKEQLLSQLEDTGCTAWLSLVRTWIRGLPPSCQPAFHGMLAVLGKVEGHGAVLVTEPSLPYIEQNISVLQGLLSKPGKSFSPEMIAALVLAAPAMSVAFERVTGRKAAGPFWLEESWDLGSSSEPSSAGVSLGNLVGLLSVYWVTPDWQA